MNVIIGFLELSIGSLYEQGSFNYVLSTPIFNTIFFFVVLSPLLVILFVMMGIECCCSKIDRFRSMLILVRWIRLLLLAILILYCTVFLLVWGGSLFGWIQIAVITIAMTSLAVFGYFLSFYFCFKKYIKSKKEVKVKERLKHLLDYGDTFDLMIDDEEIMGGKKKNKKKKKDCWNFFC